MPLFKDTQGEAILRLEGFDAADIGAIPLAQKGQPGGVASLGSDGKVPAVQLPDSDDSDLAELVQANLQAVDALADQLNSLPPSPTLTSLGGEPSGAEARANAYTDQKILQISSPTLPNWVQIPQLLNNWVHYGFGFSEVKCSIFQGEVRLKGVIKNGIAPTIFVLPEGYRPSDIISFLTPGAGGYANINIFPNGNVDVYSVSNEYVHLNPIVFTIY